MRAAARRRVRESFDYDRMIDDYEAVLAGEPVRSRGVDDRPTTRLPSASRLRRPMQS